ncbi:MAG: hypothetical protein ABSF92_07285 [Candidatus Acidiferrales bacterium]|jgi:hypothetical protein
MKAGKVQEHTTIEQAVSRALRDNLESLQRSSNELHHAIADVVAACSSSKPTHALPPMLRAQTAAASLSAALEVLSRFITAALQPAQRTPLEAEVARLVGLPAAETEPAPSPELVPAPPSDETAESLVEPEPIPPEEEIFDVSRLSHEEQEMHRRANRVAKVSMQDIKMLRPEQVRLGREQGDICIRLRDDIEKAYKEYHRRFRPILDHPVDYFYYWMVEILAGGDAQALGEYPYASPVRQS